MYTTIDKDVKRWPWGLIFVSRLFERLLSNLEALQSDGCQVELLFLEAQDDILVV